MFFSIAPHAKGFFFNIIVADNVIWVNAILA